MKKLVSVVLAISIVATIFSMCGLTAFAKTSGTCGENAYWNYDESTKTITISGTGAVHSGLAGWDELDAENVIIEDGITYIGYLHCNSMKYLKIAGSVKCISDYAIFSYNLKEVKLEYGIESLEVGPFANNPALEKVNIPGSVKTFMGCTFSYCSSLKTVILEEGIDIITEAMFLNCTSLESITIPSTVKRIDGDAFNGCTSLKEVTIPENVEIINIRAFEGCSALTEINIPESTTQILNGAFNNCSSLGKIYINNKHCLIETKDTIPENAVIYGYTDSSAEKYAEQYGREFVALDDDIISIFIRFIKSYIDFIKSLFNYFLKMI